jgi:hypothetical protein
MILCLTSTEIILITTTLFLGAVALFVPYFAELLKRKLFRPVLKVSIKLGPPDCHKTSWSNTPEPLKPVYYFRFEVKNTGKTTCRNVENSLENIWRLNSANVPIKIEDFTPVNLKWSLRYELTQQNINPDRKIYCNIGHLPTKQFQESNMKLINPIGYNGNDLRLVLDLVTVLNVQLNCLPPGSYILQINTYSENHKTVNTYFKIDWSGIWSDDITTMFQELVITKTSKPND